MLSMKKEGWQVVAVSPYDEFAEKIKRNGIRFKAMRFKRKGQNPLADFWLLLRLTVFYFQEKPSIVHHFTVKPVIYGTFAARLSGIPGIVNLVTGLGYVFFRGGLLQRLVEVLYRMSLSFRVQVIFQNGDDLGHFVRKKILFPGQTHLICGSGVDTQSYSPEKYPYALHSEPVTFILPARMLWDKGIGEFVKAARMAFQENPRTKFILMGDPDDGNPASVSKTWLEKLRKNRYLEWVEHKENIRPYLAGSSVVVLPSYREGAPRVLIEAAAMAKPIITTDVPGCREIVADGENGFLVPKKNAALLARAMLTLAGDSALRHRMGSAGRKRALRYFDENRVNQKIRDIYAKLMNNAG